MTIEKIADHRKARDPTWWKIFTRLSKFRGAANLDTDDDARNT